MLRTLNLANIALSARYVKSYKKPVVEMPSKNKPKYIYQIKYHPSANPGVDMGFPEHQNLNDWDVHSASHFQNFRYSYGGQWWQEKPILKIFLLFGPIIFMFLAYFQLRKHSKHRRGNCMNLTDIDTFSHKSLIAPQI